MTSLFILCLMGISILPSIAFAQNFVFDWPAETAQCQTVNLTWQGGKAPFQAFITPIFGQPFIYNIPQGAYSNGQGSVPISIQLNSGVSYVVFLSDANGLGTGGTSEIQIVTSSQDSSCLGTAKSNSSNLDFTFDVSGRAQQCTSGFDLDWSAGKQDAPFNFTVIPLDQKFRPFDVKLPDALDENRWSWTLNLTSLARFSIMMNSNKGYGRGGVGGIYQVADSATGGCNPQTPQTTGQWPAGLATNSLPSSTITPGSESGSGGLPKGAIAGIAVGAVVGILAVLLALLFLLRRRKSREAAQGKMGVHAVDLGDGGGGTSGNGGMGGYDEPQPIVEPYRQVGSFAPPPGHSHTHSGDMLGYGGQSGQSGQQSGYSTGESGMRASTLAGYEMDRTTTTDSSRYLDEDHRGSGPGLAGPLPMKSTRPSSAGYPTGGGFTPRNPQSPGMTSTTYGSQIKAPITAQTTSTPSNGPPSPLLGPSMRVVYHDDPESLPMLPPGATANRYNNGDRRRRSGVPTESGPTFRRHEDGGRVLSRPAVSEEEVVDLPPLYTDVPRDGDGAGERGVQGVQGMQGEEHAVGE